MAAWHTRLSFASSRPSEGRNELNPVIYFSRGNHIRNQGRADISKRFARERFTEQLYFRPALPFSSIVLADVPSGPLSPRLYNFLVWASLFPRVSRKVTSSRRKNRPPLSLRPFSAWLRTSWTEFSSIEPFFARAEMITKCYEWSAVFCTNMYFVHIYIYTHVLYVLHK